MVRAVFCGVANASLAVVVSHVPRNWGRLRAEVVVRTNGLEDDGSCPGWAWVGFVRASANISPNISDSVGKGVHKRLVETAP
jgi:hypothetical protein